MKKEIKKIFQDSFEGFDSPVDTQGLLSGIAAKRKKKKKDRIPLWIFPVSIMALGLIVMILDGAVGTVSSEAQWYADDKTIDNREVKTPINIEQTQLSDSEISIQEKASRVSGEVVIGNELKRELISINNLTTKSTQVINPISNLKGGEHISSNLANEYIATSLFKTSITKDNKKDVELRQESELQNEQEFSSLSEEIVESENNTSKTNSDIREVAVKENSELDSDALALSEEGDKELLLNEYEEISESVVAPETSKEQLPIAADVKSPCVQNKVSFNLLGGGTLLLSDFEESVIGVESEQALSQGYGFSTELSLSYTFYKNFTIGVGVDYSSYTQLFQWSGEYVVDREGAYVGEEIDPSFISDDYLFFIQERDIANYNRRSFVDIPLSLSFRKQLGRVRLEPSFTVAFNVYASQTGFTINGNLIAEELEAFSYEVGPKLQAGLGLEYGLSDKWNFISRATFSRRKISDGILDEVLFLPELSVGIRYNLSSK